MECIKGDEGDMEHVQTQNSITKNNLWSAKALTMIGLMSAISFILMFLHFPIKFIGFLELELSDIPAVLCGLLYGPLAGVCVELIKNLLHMMASSTAMVGEIANFLIASSYVVGVTAIFKYAKSEKKLRNGFIIGTILLIIMGVTINYFITLPMYITLYFGGDESVLYQMAGAMIPAIKDMKTILLFGFVPFNLVKGIVLSVVTYYVWKVLRKFTA